MIIEKLKRAQELNPQKPKRDYMRESVILSYICAGVWILAGILWLWVAALNT